MRLYLRSVRGDRDKPVLPIRAQQLHAGEHRCRIFGAKADQVYHIRVDGIPRDGLRVIRVAHQHKPCTQAVRKPRAVKAGYIGAETCL